MKFVFSTIVALALFITPAIGQDFLRVYIDAAQTADAGNSEERVQQEDFGEALAASLVKRKVPVVIVTDKNEANLIIQSTSAQHQESAGVQTTRIVSSILTRSAGGFGSSKRFEGAIQVVDVESSAILFAYNVSKNNYKSAAEDFANEFKSHLKRKPAIAQNLPRVYVESVEAVDAEDSEKKVQHLDFGMALAAALLKHKVPVLLTTDKDNADWIMQSISELQVYSDKSNIAGTVFSTVLFGRTDDSFANFKGTIQVMDTENSEIFFANNISKSSDFKSAAEKFAKNLKKHLNRKR